MQFVYALSLSDLPHHYTSPVTSQANDATTQCNLGVVVVAVAEENLKSRPNQMTPSHIGVVALLS